MIGLCGTYLALPATYVNSEEECANYVKNAIADPIAAEYKPNSGWCAGVTSTFGCATITNDPDYLWNIQDYRSCKFEGQ